MFKAVLFDLDGTLLDTLADINRCVNNTMRAFGYPELTMEQTRSFVGDGLHKLIERALPGGAPCIEACCARCGEEFERSDGALIKPYAGAEVFLAHAKSRGILLGVVTNKPQEAAVRILQRFFPATFSFIGGDSGLFPRKPDPSLALYGALKMRVPPCECAFVGDGETDVRTAAAAEMFGIAATWGYRSRSVLEGAGAVRFAADYGELEKILFSGDTKY